MATSDAFGLPEPLRLSSLPAAFHPPRKVHTHISDVHAGLRVRQIRDAGGGIGCAAGAGRPLVRGAPDLRRVPVRAPVLAALRGMTCRWVTEPLGVAAAGCGMSARRLLRRPRSFWRLRGRRRETLSRLRWQGHRSEERRNLGGGDISMAVTRLLRRRDVSARAGRERAVATAAWSGNVCGMSRAQPSLCPPGSANASGAGSVALRAQSSVCLYRLEVPGPLLCVAGRAFAMASCRRTSV